MQNYELLYVVGKGSYGKVYKSRDKETKEDVAIKKYERIDVSIAMRETKILKKVSGGNHICELIDHFYSNGSLFIVMKLYRFNMYEYIYDKIERNSMIGSELIINMCNQVLSALAFLASRGIVHSDIKPANIVVDKAKEDGSRDYVLIDFSISFSETEYPEYVTVSWPYRPPEMILRDNISCKLDLWSLGIIALEMSVGVLFYPSIMNEFGGCEGGCDIDEYCACCDKDLDTIAKLMEDKETILDTYVKNPTLREIISKLLTFNVDDRPTAQELLLYKHRKDYSTTC